MNLRKGSEVEDRGVIGGQGMWRDLIKHTVYIKISTKI